MAREEEPLALLRELERMIHARPTLEAEWQQAWADFASGRQDAATFERFREWFLLERSSEILGGPPAVVLAPQSFEPESGWERLLDSFLGIFRRSGDPTAAGLPLVDLWSGRLIVAASPGGGDWLGDDYLAVGRFVLVGEEQHVALPGLLVLRAPGLIEAVERDLAAIRARDPRARLSQLQCERLFAPYRLEPPAEERQSVEAALRAALRDASGWSLERLRRQLAERGPSETLDLLAFETEVDLERLRRLLPAYLQELESEEGSAQPLEPGTQAAEEPLAVSDALARFDRGRAEGLPLERLFADLEHDLGLQPGVSEEAAPLDEALPDPPSAASFQIWVDTYAWERRAAGEPVDPEEARWLAQFTAFLDAAGAGTELRSLSTQQVLGYLLSAPSADELRLRRRALEPFLQWAVREQEAPLQPLLRALAGSLATRLGRIITCNAALASGAAGSREPAIVASTDPLQVQAADAETALVAGLPETFADLPQVGDVLIGRWVGGRFQVVGLLPAEALAASTTGPA